MLLCDFIWVAISSFTGSLFLILLLFIFAKPAFKISHDICLLDTVEYGEDLKGSYLIKVANKFFFDAYDLKANIELLESYEVEGGTNSRSFDFNIVDKTTKYLSGKHLYENTGKSCFLFRSTEDLKSKLMSSGNKLRFNLIAENSFSGLNKNFCPRIKNGHFGFGKDFDIS